MRAFLDTNILLYAFGTDPVDLEKRRRARDLLTDGDPVLSVQVVNEFVWQATRKGGGHGISTPVVAGLVEDLLRFDVVSLDAALVRAAGDIRDRTNYSWWDCMIVAAARQARCDILYTEDMQHGHVVDGVRIENPFRDLG